MAMIKRIAFLCAFVLVAMPAWATTYYVDGTISPASCGTYSIAMRNCSGSDGTAYKTAAGGVAVLAAGDTLNIRAGTYATTLRWDNKNGASGNPITIRPYLTETVTFQPSSSQNGTHHSSWVNIGAFVFDCVLIPAGNADCLSGNTDGSSSVNVTDAIWDGFTVKNSGRANGGYNITDTVAANTGVFGHFDRTTFKNCFVFNNGNGKLDHGWYISGSFDVLDNCEIYHNSGQGLQRYPSGDNWTIRNNKAYDNAQSGTDGAGLLVIGGGGGDVLYNNLTYNNKGGIVVGGAGAAIYNNTTYSNFAAGGGAGIEDRNGNAVCTNNLVNSESPPFPLTPITGCSTQTTNITTGSAVMHFINPGSDFHLRNGSSAIDTGTTIGSISSDIVGTPRPTGIAYDVGAYEYTDTLPLVFNYYSPYVIDHTKVPSNQTSFPVWISLTDARFKTVANGGHVQSNLGYDVRMASNANCAGANLIPYQLMNYTASTGAIQLRVVTNLSSSVDTTVYFCYGNSTLTVDGSSSAVWDADYLAVWPLGQLGSLSLTDFSGHGVNGTGINSPTALAGQVDGGVTLSAVGRQYIDAGSAIAPTAITIEAWVNPTSFPHTYNSIVSRVATNFSSFADITVKDTGKIAFYTQTTGGTPNYDGAGSHTLLVANWYHVVGTYDSTSGMIGYVNAASDGTAAANGTLATATADTHIGDDPPFNSMSDNRNWNGLIDEVKISKIARSADWITTTYNNEGPNANTFAALGAENNVTPPAGPVSVFAPKIFSPGIFHSAIFH